MNATLPHTAPIARWCGRWSPRPSVALHEKCGLEKVAHFREVGFKFDRWIDVGYWQRTL
jgi:L-amino acid N-acyltransferase YncA